MCRPKEPHVDAQAASRLLAAAAQGFLGLCQFREYPPAIAEIVRTRRRDGDLAGGTVQELHAKPPLEPAHMSTHHRAREREFVGGPREGPEFRNPGKGLHRLQKLHRPISKY
jgi:hypothetical protein